MSIEREAAKKILQLQLDTVIQDRVEELASRANQGMLSPDERSEYRTYIDFADLLSLLKLKARRSLEAEGDN